MKIYLGSFDNMEYYNKKGLFIISIATQAPEGYEGYKEPLFAPSVDLDRKWREAQITKEEFEKAYLEGLNEEVIKWWVDNYDNVFGDKEVIMLSHAPSGKYSHRNALANYLDEHFDIEVDELLPV